MAHLHIIGGEPAEVAAVLGGVAVGHLLGELREVLRACVDEPLVPATCRHHGLWGEQGMEVRDEEEGIARARARVCVCVCVCVRGSHSQIAGAT